MLDMTRHELTVRGQPVPMQPRVFALLRYFAMHPGQLLSKDQLLQAVWPTQHVSDAVLATAVRKVRLAIDDGQDGHNTALATVHGVGYRFDAVVQHAAPDAEPASLEDGSGSAQHDGLLGVLRMVNDTGDSAFDWVEVGLACLLHDKLGGGGAVRLLPLNSSLQWRQPDGHQLRTLGAPCRALGAHWVLSCRLVRMHTQLRLDASWGSDDAAVTRWHSEGTEEVLLVEELAAAVLAHATRRTPGAQHAPSQHSTAPLPGSVQRDASRSADVMTTKPFWQAQLARAMDLQQRGQAEQALDLLQACRHHLDGSASICLLHVKLLRERMSLDQARAELQRGLASCDPVREAHLMPLFLVEDAALRCLQGDLPGAQTCCERALASITQNSMPAMNMPEVLTMASGVDFELGNYKSAAHKARRAVDIASALGDKAAVATSMFTLARAVQLAGEVQTARATLTEALALVAGIGLTGLEANCYLRLSFLEADQWQSLLALDYARRSAALASVSGDLVVGHRARIRAMLCLIDLGQLEEASAELHHDMQTAAHWGASVARNNHRRVRYFLDWRLGLHASAITLLSEALAETPPNDAVWRPILALALTGMLLNLGQVEPAAALFATVQATESQRSRIAYMQAYFALVKGDRDGCKRLLKADWLACAPDEPGGWANLVALVWLMLEDDETAGLPLLMRQVDRLPRDAGSLPLLLHLHQVRCGTVPWRFAEWARLVRSNAGLLNRHAWMLDEARCAAWLAGDGPKLAALLPDACY